MAEIVVQILVDPFLVRQDDAAEAAALAVDMLGGRVDDDMRAELERLLLQRRGEDVVDDQPRADRIGELGDDGDVDHLQRRVGRALQEEQLGVRPDRLFPRFAVSVPSTSVVSMPYFGSKVSITQRQEPNSARAATTWSPARAVHSSAAVTAAMPDAVARASSAPSSAHMRFSNMSTVGLA